MSGRHADNWSHPGHYLVDPYTWPWSPNGHGHEWPTATTPPLCNVNLPSHSEIQLFQNLTKKIHGQGHVCGQRSRSRLTFKIQGSRLYGQGQTHWLHLRPEVELICLLFVSWQSDHFWLRYRKFHIWPWKFKVRLWPRSNLMVTSEALSSIVMAKVKADGHIWSLKFHGSVCFSFRGNWTIFGWDIANSIFDLEKSRSRSQRKSTKIWSGNLQVRANNCAKNDKKSKKLFKSYRVNKKLRPVAAAAAAYEQVQKHEVTPGIPGWLN